MMASSLLAASQSTRSTLNRIDPHCASAFVQYSRSASLPCTTDDPVTASAVGLAKMMSSRKCASTASTSRRFQACAQSTANFSASVRVEIMYEPCAHEEE